MKKKNGYILKRKIEIIKAIFHAIRFCSLIVYVAFNGDAAQIKVYT